MKLGQYRRYQSRVRNISHYARNKILATSRTTQCPIECISRENKPEDVNDQSVHEVYVSIVNCVQWLMLFYMSLQIVYFPGRTGRRSTYCRKQFGRGNRPLSCRMSGGGDFTTRGSTNYQPRVRVSSTQGAIPFPSVTSGSPRQARRPTHLPVAVTSSERANERTNIQSRTVRQFVSRPRRDKLQFPAGVFFTSRTAPCSRSFILYELPSTNAASIRTATRRLALHVAATAANRSPKQHAMVTRKSGCQTAIPRMRDGCVRTAYVAQLSGIFFDFCSSKSLPNADESVVHVPVAATPRQDCRAFRLRLHTRHEHTTVHSDLRVFVRTFSVATRNSNLNGPCIGCSTAPSRLASDHPTPSHALDRSNRLQYMCTGDGTCVHVSLREIFDGLERKKDIQR